MWYYVVLFLHNFDRNDARDAKLPSGEQEGTPFGFARRLNVANPSIGDFN